jgi:hypothetical protein
MKNLDIFNNSIWIISVLKSWKEIALGLLNLLFQEIFKTKQACIVEPVFFKNSDEYIKNVNKITQFSFSVASVNSQRSLGVKNSDWLWEIFKIKDELWWDSLSFMVNSKEWLTKNKIKWFCKNFQHLSIKSPKITVDECWKILKQEIDKIRFKSLINLKLVNRELDKVDIELKMKSDFISTLSKIEEEYLYLN